MLAGRSPERLLALADDLGGLETAHADVMRRNSVFDAGRARATCSSPPSARSPSGASPPCGAAIAARGTYLDSTGEPAFIRRVFEESRARRRARPARALLTAMGYDFVPGALAGALALEEAGEDAVRVDVGYYALGDDHPERERRHARVAGRRLARRRATRSATARCAACATGRARARRSRSRARTRPAVSVGGAEHLALPGRVSAAARGQRLPRLVRPAGAADAGGDAGRLGRRARPGRARRRCTFAGERLVGAGRRARGRHDARRRVVDRRRGVRRRRAASSPRCTSPAATGTRSPPTFIAWAARAARAGGSRAPARSGRSRRSGSRSSSAAARRRAQPRQPPEPAGRDAPARADQRPRRLDAAVRRHPQRRLARAVEQLPAQAVERLARGAEHRRLAQRPDLAPRRRRPARRRGSR